MVQNAIIANLMLFAFGLGSSMAHASDRMVLIFDASLSMKRPGTSGASRFEEAGEAARKLAPQFSSGGRQIGLVAFGHAGASCEVKSVFPPSAAAGGRIPIAIQGMTPQGLTPLAESLKVAAAQLAKGHRADRGDRIILLTDGAETCGGDPVGMAKSLRARYPGLSIHVVGFSIGVRQSAELRMIAVAGGGSIQIAHGAGSLESALSSVIKGDFIAPASPMPEITGKAPIMDPDSIPSELNFGDSPQAESPSLSQMEAELADVPAPFKAAPMPDEPDPKQPPEKAPGTLPPEPEVSPIPLL